MPLKKIAQGLWIHDQPLAFLGLEVGTRMTVVDLDGKGTLFVHSPNRLDEEMRSSLASLGKVAHVISPNRWHHLFISDFKAAFPEAKFYCAPGLEKKRADFHFDAVIGDGQNYPWNPALAHLSMKGIPMYNEVVFFHPATKTLILTDLAVHICKSESLVTRLWLRMIGSYGKFGWAKIEKLLFIKDQTAFRETIRQVLDWDFERIILAHGELIEAGGKARLAEAFR